MKKLLIISPYFPPSNAADMQRVRMSLPYFKVNDWEVEVITVDEQYSDINKDDLLRESIPCGIKIHQVKALSKKWTSKLGLGSIALRSLWFYKKKVNRLLQEQHFDLIYFSTTQFPVLTLGRYWKRKFKIPYVIDMQDPWHSDYYQNKPKAEQPPKYWFSYRLNKYLERFALKKVDGLISVSSVYIDDLFKRYPSIANVPFSIIPFGVNKYDFEIATKHIEKSIIQINNDKLNFVYTGAVGHIMKDSISFLCKTLAHLKQVNFDAYSKMQFYFIGTSYASAGKGIATVLPIAQKYGVESCIIEKIDRIGFYDSLHILKKADALLILGSDAEAYNPSKIFTYILADKPLLSIFKDSGPAVKMLEDTNVANVIKYSHNHAERELTSFIIDVVNGTATKKERNETLLISYSAEALTQKQCELFNTILID